MKCNNCGQDYPSRYYFRKDNICKTCYNKLNPEKKKIIDKKSKLPDEDASNKLRHTSGIARFLNIVLIVIFLSIMKNMIISIWSCLDTSSPIESYSINFNVQDMGVIHLNETTTLSLQVNDARGIVQINNPTTRIRIFFIIVKRYFVYNLRRYLIKWFSPHFLRIVFEEIT